MADEDAILGVGVDPTQAEQGARRAVRSLDDIRRAGKELDGQMGKSRKGLDDTGRSMGRVSSASDVLARGIRQLAAVFATFKLTQATKDMTTLAARIETLDVVLQAVGANVGLSKRQVESYAEGVKAMGITTQEAKNTVIQLIQAQIDLEQSSKLARLAQDAAVIGNTNSSDALARLVFGIKTAQVEVLRTIGLNVSFERSYATLAKELGVTVDSLTEQQRTQARINEVMRQGVFISGSYEASMQTANKVLGSSTRFAEEASRKVGDIFLPAYKQAVFAYYIALQDLNKELDTLVTDRAPAAGKALSDNGPLKDFTDKAKELQNTIRTTFEETALTIARVVDAVSPLFLALGKGIATFINVWNRLPDWMQDVGLIGGLFLGRTGFKIVAISAAIIGALDEQLDKLAKKTDEVLKAAGASQGVRDFFADPAGLGQAGAAKRKETISVSDLSRGLFGEDGTTNFEAKVRDLFNRAGEKAGKPVPNVPVKAPPGAPPRTDISIVSLDKSNKLLLEQAAANDRLAAATLNGVGAVQRETVENKVKLFILEKLNGNTKEAERVVTDYRKAVEASEAAARKLSQAQNLVSTTRKVEADERLAAAAKGGALALKQAEIAEKARAEAIKVADEETVSFTQSYEKYLSLFRRDEVAQATRGMHLWIEAQQEAIDAANRLAQAQAGGRAALRAAEIENAARAQLKINLLDPKDPTNATTLDAARRQIAAVRRAEGNQDHQTRLIQLQDELALVKTVQDFNFKAAPERAGEIAYLQEKTRLQRTALDLTAGEIEAQSRMAAEIAKVQTAAAERFQTINDASSAIASGFERAAIEGGKLRDVLGGIAQDIQRIAYNRLVTKPLERGIGSLIDGVMPFADGGMIHGPGGPRSDNILARLSPGEYIVNAASTRQFKPLLDIINNAPRFAFGGEVGRQIASLPQTGGGMVINAPISVTVEGGGDSSGRGGPNPQEIGRAVRTEVKTAFAELLREEMRPGNMLNQGF